VALLALGTGLRVAQPMQAATCSVTSDAGSASATTIV